MLYAMLSGVPPFAGKTEDEIMKKVKAGKYSFTSKYIFFIKNVFLGKIW